MKEDYNYLDNLPSIMKKLTKGITVSVEVDGVINPICISWGSIGHKWNTFIFTTYIRTNRFTHELLEKADSFTVNIPLDIIDPEILKVTGTMSGREINKIDELNLTTIKTRTINSVGIKELPITLECRKVYTQPPSGETLDSEFKNKFYPSNVDSKYHGSNQDFHTCFYGEIVDSYIIK